MKFLKARKMFFVFCEVICVLTVFVNLFFPLVSNAQTKDPMDVRVGMYDNYPKIYKDANGNIRGFWSDITNDIAKKENWNVIYVYDTWDNNLSRLEKGEIDFMVDVAVSEDRKVKYDFNEETALISWGIFYSRKNLSINSFRDLEGKNIAILKSSIHYEAPLGLKNMLTSFGMNANIIGVENYQDVFGLLDNNRADVGVVSWYFGVANEDKYKVNRSNIIFDPTELRYAFPKNSDKTKYLSNVIDFHLRELKDDRNSIYYESIRTNFGSSLQEVEVLPLWAKWLLIVGGIVLLVALIVGGAMHYYQVTLRRKIEEKTKDLQDSNKFTQTLFDTIPFGMHIINGKGEILFMNKNLEDKYGKNFVGRKCWEVYSENKTQSCNCLLRKGIDIKETSETETRECVSGKVLRITYAGMKYENENALLEIFQDITEQKKSEENIHELDNLKSKFIATLSHVTRTPLTGIVWTLESLLSGSFGDLRKEQRALIYQVLDSGKKISNVIDDMNIALDIERGAVAIDLIEFELGELIKSTGEQFRPLCELKGISYKINIPKENAKALAKVDPEKIRHVLNILLENAVSYILGEGSIVLNLLRDKGVFRVEVSDTGIGIPKNEQRDIFGRFYRASNATAVYTDGLGIGLYIAKAIIDKHGGKIGFASTEGKGSTFWFELPAIEFFE